MVSVLGITFRIDEMSFYQKSDFSCDPFYSLDQFSLLLKIVTLDKEDIDILIQ